jgi:hypothetical protein
MTASLCCRRLVVFQYLLYENWFTGYNLPISSWVRLNILPNLLYDRILRAINMCNISCILLEKYAFSLVNGYLLKTEKSDPSETMLVLYILFCVWWGWERGPLSLVSTTEELLDRKVAAPV